MKIANYITLQVTLEFDAPVDPDEVRKYASMAVDNIWNSPIAEHLQDTNTRLAE